ncbi:MAG: hypothetical protein IPO66_20720 [Rhodanobacteraceae bacterium]|nr:hypothetical protein [Rhodanobacteraceae bacterium]
MEASALASYESGDVQDALAKFRNLLSMCQTHQTALRFLAFEVGLRGDHAAAVGFLVRAADAYPQDLVVLFDLGRAQVALEQWTMALDTFERMVLLDAGNIDAMLHCGHCMERLGQTQDVALAYLRATRAAEGLDPRQIPNETKRFLNYALEFVRTYLDGEIELSLAPIESEFGREALARIRKAADIYVGKRPLERAHAKWRPGLLYVPDLPVRTWFERGEFDWVEKVESAVDAVRDELLGDSWHRRFVQALRRSRGGHPGCQNVP